MAHLVTSLKEYFELEETNIDNWAFKLFYKVSCGLCMAGATIGVLTQYFGDPISCQSNGALDGKEYMKDYCWIHGSAVISTPKEMPTQDECPIGCDITSLNIDEDEAKGLDTSFYQWVTFMMVLQAAVFFLPHKIWHTLEGGLVESFGTEAKQKILLKKKDNHDKAVGMEETVDKFVKYFKSIHHHNSWYFGYFVFCEFLNFSLLGVQIKLTNTFLNNQFAWYGWNVLNYFSTRHELGPRAKCRSNNPVCAVFPTEVSCMFPNFGAAGGRQDNNGLCILTQNIINEKMYLALWFWYAFLVPVSIFFLFYRLFTLFSSNLRFNLIYKTICHKYDKNIKKSLNYVLLKCQLGDWFVLYQLCKNCNPYFYREFIKDLARELHRKPKQTKAPSKDQAAVGALTLPDKRTVKRAFDPTQGPVQQTTAQPSEPNAKDRQSKKGSVGERASQFLGQFFRFSDPSSSLDVEQGAGSGLDMVAKAFSFESQDDDEDDREEQVMKKAAERESPDEDADEEEDDGEERAYKRKSKQKPQDEKRASSGV